MDIIQDTSRTIFIGIVHSLHSVRLCLLDFVSRRLKYLSFIEISYVQLLQICPCIKIQLKHGAFRELNFIYAELDQWLLSNFMGSKLDVILRVQKWLALVAQWLAHLTTELRSSDANPLGRRIIYLQTIPFSRVSHP